MTNEALTPYVEQEAREQVAGYGRYGQNGEPEAHRDQGRRDGCHD